MKISVIVPVYNVEKYLARCLDSLVNQTIDSIEILVVNDGSKDNSLKIIEDYSKRFSAIKYYSKENGGLSSARNYAIPMATGEYLAFLDSDDYVELDLYEKLYNKAKNENAEIVVGDIEYFWENEEKYSYIMKGSPKVEPTKKDMFLAPLFSWNKIYKRTFFIESQLQYPLGLWYEDIPVTLSLFAKANKISYLEGNAFHYLQRMTSILGSKDNPKMYDIFTIFNMVVYKFKQDELYCLYYDELEYLYIEHFLLYGAFRFLRTTNYLDLMTKARLRIKIEFPKWRKNKYLKSLSFKYRFFIRTNCYFTYWIYRLLIGGK